MTTKLELPRGKNETVTFSELEDGKFIVSFVRLYETREEWEEDRSRALEQFNDEFPDHKIDAMGRAYIDGGKE